MEAQAEVNADELSAKVREIVDANMYMTLATADGEGRPWATPVWYAHDRYTEFVWVSRPGARHSRNLAARGEVGIAIFDSTVAVGGAQAVYLEAVAKQLTGDAREHGIDVFSRRLERATGENWDLSRVTPPAELRLYRAQASAHFLLGETDERIPVQP